jgi:transposase
MSAKNEYTGAEKLAILQELETGQAGRLDVAGKYNISITTLKKWRHRYELYGLEGLEIKIHQEKYSSELKLQAVQDYLSGDYSQYQIIDKYKIASRTQLASWINKYNSHSSFRSYENGGAGAMTKGRSTNWEERIEVVLHNHDYLNTSETYQVSYQQVYQWVKKYETGGEDALKDGR